MKNIDSKIANFRLRPAAVTTLACEQVLEACCHYGGSYQEALDDLAEKGMWVSHDTWRRFCLSYNASVRFYRHFNNSPYTTHRYQMIAKGIAHS